MIAIGALPNDDNPDNSESTLIRARGHLVDGREHGVSNRFAMKLRHVVVPEQPTLV